jgi:hypothetical protein
MVYAGAVLVALLSVTTEVVLGALQRRLTPGRAPRRTLAALRPEQTPTGEVRAA